jgi:hypothetical protein
VGALLSRTRSHLRSHLGTRPNPDRRCPFAASDGGLSGAAASPTATQLPIRDVTGASALARQIRLHDWPGPGANIADHDHQMVDRCEAEQIMDSRVPRQGFKIRNQDLGRRRWEIWDVIQGGQMRVHIWVMKPESAAAHGPAGVSGWLFSANGSELMPTRLSHLGVSDIQVEPPAPSAALLGLGPAKGESAHPRLSSMKVRVSSSRWWRAGWRCRAADAVDGDAARESGAGSIRRVLPGGGVPQPQPARGGPAC